MPASPGDQHKQPNGIATQNPFVEEKPHIQEYTAQQIATLSSRLNKRLGPEYIATRTGPGNSKVAYLPAEKVIGLANEVFGFNGWSSSVQNIQIDYVEENAAKGTVSIGLSVVVRVTLRDGTYHEDIGYGSIDNSRSKAAAFEKAKKEGTTDALKRTMRNFGNVLGNCIYDKDYIKKVSQIKIPNGRFDVNDLYRHEDFAVKKEKEEPERKPLMKAPAVPTPVQQLPPQIVPEDSFDNGEFDGAFDDCDLADFDTDEVAIPENVQSKPQPSHLNSRLPPSNMTPSKPPQHRPDQQNTSRLPSITNSIPNIYAQQPIPPQPRSQSPGETPQHFNPQIPVNPAVGFFSAKAADSLDSNGIPIDPTAAKRFDPHAESPSIRKTQGVDHSKTTALNRSLKVEAPVTRDADGNIVGARPAEPRRVSSPAGFSPVAAGRGGGMTSAYKPPSRPRVTTPSVSHMGDRSTSGNKRPPLSDVSNVQQGPDPGSGEKRQRTGPGLSGSSENYTAG